MEELVETCKIDYVDIFILGCTTKILINNRQQSK